MANSRQATGIAFGIAAVFALHVVWVLIATPIVTNLFEPNDPRNYLRGINSLIYTMMSLGVSQLLYVVPLGLWLKRKRRMAMVKGVIIGAVMTMLLTGLCFITAF
ncbi:MAG: hypothetical protein AAFO06_00855 [Cyanobacteria bacterium J06597_16]